MRHPYQLLINNWHGQNNQHTLSQRINQFKSVFNLEFQPKFGFQLGIPIQMGIDLGECIAEILFFDVVSVRVKCKYHEYWGDNVGCFVSPQ